ncbi:MAG: fatty-acyl-CoA synthase, partial [Caulobacteraceae bacterium]|nr:fatty-acyl-CoA synthase [Caulobacteraceae bacterium]
PHVPIVFGSRERPCETTIGQLWTESAAVAAGFQALGLRENDVIVCQVPNWKEAALTLLAALRLGLLFVPVIHTYGAAELGFILETMEATALVVPARWKKIDFGARVGGLPVLPHLKHVIVVGEGEVPGPVVAWDSLAASAPVGLPALQAGPDDPWLVMFTSGTTSSPKGVVHTHHSFAAEVENFPAALSPTGRPRFSPLPGGHSAGMISILRPFVAHDPAVLMDAFEEAFAIELIKKHRPDRAGGVPFMMSIYLKHAADLFPDGVVQMSVGAASVPPALLEACERLGWPGTRTYGSTEHPTISGGSPADPYEKRAKSDGRLLAGVSVRLVDDEGAPVADGQPGEIVSMGPDLFKGYLDPAHNAAAFADDGWFHTGDIGVLDADGFLSIVDRKKDIIIRGGENISSKEVEDVLMLHPQVAEVAVVAWPDARLGERVGVFVKLKSGELTLDEVCTHFANAGLSIQKTPERLVIIDGFPRTPAGKILKTELRERVRAMVADAGALL